LTEVRAKLLEVERKSSREIKALNQEVSFLFRYTVLFVLTQRAFLNNQVSELESLVESKIFREGELTDELAHVRRLLSRAEQQGLTVDEKKRKGAIRAASPDGDGLPVCELCGEDHGIENCPLFGDTNSDAGADRPSTNGRGGHHMYCEDCEVSVKASLRSCVWDIPLSLANSQLSIRQTDVLLPTKFFKRPT
jgi:CAP-Gly domain-containing linker protein 1